ncbi:MAG TPA: CoA transferase [Dehalococcoidia bacterium]|nr:CoA transferase [Dehalococcoidia bacterium]
MDREQTGQSGLNGYRVLDLTDEKGFLCGKIMADLGADVIKIEPPGGDPSRYTGPFYEDKPDPEKNLQWWVFNTSKRGITLDVTNEDGRSAFLRLVEDSDFVIESFMPGRMAELGLGYEELSKVNPGIILASISGFGQDGPYARYKATDIVCQAMAGITYLTGDPDRAPLRISVPQSFLNASNDATTGALIALWHREKTGLGQWVDVSAQECVAWQGFSNQTFWFMQQESPTRENQAHNLLTVGRPTVPDIYRCRDGYVLLTPERGRNGRRTRKLVDWMVEEDSCPSVVSEFDWEETVLPPVDLTEEEREQLILEMVQTAFEMRRHFQKFFLTKDKQELFQQAVERGFLLAPLNDIKEVAELVQFRAREFWQEVEHPEIGKTLMYPGAPFRSNGMQYRIRSRAPLIGEHNDEILSGKLKPIRRQEAAHDLAALENVDSTEAFRGLKVLDFTWITVGPRSVRYFADHGATVVKVEAPERPDGGRGIPPLKDMMPHPDHSAWFCIYNINKHAITIDLTKPEGIELVKKLIVWADVLIESFRPGVMKRFGLDYESIQKLNPGLVYASTSMFGQSGPYHQYAGFGHHAAAITGYDLITGWPDRAPCGAFWAYSDHVAPQMLVSAIVTALLEKRRTGVGQYIDQAQNESALLLLGTPLLDYAANGRIAERLGGRDPNASPHGAFPCLGKDRWCVMAVQTDEEWHRLSRVMGQQPGLAEDPRFATLADRKANEDELEALVGQWTGKYNPFELMKLLQEAGIAAGVVETAEDMHHDPQFRYREHFLEFEHPVMGKVYVDALPPRFSRTPARQYLPPPCLGEHNAYVCSEILSLPDEEFVNLIEKEVFGPL